ncbi:alpha/beta hydrolase family protein [Pseudoalteromonas sp.]|uniref:alpha/beta hydrolase family protein n=1 Tax=Pseudoalteromonas sp. TaxID=53249 RepID=UPI0035697D10
MRSFTWLNEERIYFVATFAQLSKGDNYRFTFERGGLFDLEEEEAIWPFKGQKFSYNISGPSIINRLPNDPEHILISHYHSNVNGDTIEVLYKMNIEDGDRDQFFKEKRNTNWVIDDEGEVKIYQAYDFEGENLHWYFKESAYSDFIQLKIKQEEQLVPFKTQFILKYEQSNNEIYFYQREEEGTLKLAKAGIEKGIVGSSEIVADYGKYDLGYAIRDYHTSKALGLGYTKDFKHADYLFDSDLRQVQADLEATFPNSSVTLTSYSKNRTRFIAHVSGPQNPGEYFLYDRKAGRLDLVGKEFGIDVNSLNAVSVFTYKTSDDLSIDGYFTTPKQFEGKKPPLIVLPHGGPEARDNLSFDWLRQFYAMNGFAVYQPNFRGSSGYGKTFAKLGYGQWGLNMQRDIDEGVSALISEGKVDGERVCIVGASYGGYAAMIGATKKPKRYKCAVSYGGVSDLDDIFYHTNRQNGSNRYWAKSIGNRDEQDALNANSPVKLISENTSPILLIHGDQDTVVPPYQSRNMYKYLKNHGVKSCKLVELEGDDHWFSSNQSRKIFLEESLTFINKIL